MSMDLPQLPSRPKAEVLSVGDILDAARSGRFRIPQFQTGLRWGAKHVEALFDSILRGFPVGGLLLWQRAAEAQTLSFGPVPISAGPMGDAWFVVDGQQRVTALVGALLHPDSPPLGGTHAVWVNLSTGNFQVHRQAPSLEWIPLNIIGDRPRLHQWARALEAGEATDKLVARAFEIEAILTRYELPAYVVRDAEPRALKLIFSRVNNAGVPLNEAEVFEALFGEDGQAGARPLRQLSVDIASETAFGQLSEAWLLRCVKAVAGLSARQDFSEENPASKQMIADSRAALLRAIGFLQGEAGFVHASLLPYRFPLIVLARLFHLHPAPGPRNRTLLVRWVWRGALSGEHTNSSHHAVTSHLADLEFDEDEALQRLLRRTPKVWEMPDPMAGWYGQAATTRLYATLMWTLGPWSPIDEGPLAMSGLGTLLDARDIGEVFRRLIDDAAHPIAGRFLWPASGHSKLQDRSPEFLYTHAIRGDGVSALLAGDLESVLVHRASVLRDEMSRLIELMAAPGESDRAPIRALLAS